MSIVSIRKGHRSIESSRYKDTETESIPFLEKDIMRCDGHLIDALHNCERFNKTLSAKNSMDCRSLSSYTRRKKYSLRQSSLLQPKKDQDFCR